MTAPSENASTPHGDSSDHPTRLGIIGCGGILRKIYSNILNHLSEYVSVEGLCDLSSENLDAAAKLFPGARCASSIPELLEGGQIDAVMVLTSESANARVAMEVLEAGVPVYLEKPPALSGEEFQRLRAAEDAASAPLFVAFNRRHTPLLRGVDLPKNPLRIKGRMIRQERDVFTFPYTALHLLDSLLYYAQAEPSEIHPDFEPNPVATWRLTCVLNACTPVSLEIKPDGETHCEYLIFEGTDKTVDIQFPNPESDFPEGRVTTTPRDGYSVTLTGDPHAPFEEHMGYAPALRGFLEHLCSGKGRPPSYRLESCQSAIALMEEMLNASGKVSSQAQAL